MFATGEPVLSFSAGKDSGVCLELLVMVARELGRLPVRVVMRDEEVMFPGTYEYAERVAARRDEIDFHWVYACQPVLNVFNRKLPYFWVFDPQLSSERWVRQPPSIAYRIEDLNIQNMVTHRRLRIDPSRLIWSVLGLRASESPNRSLSIFSKGGWAARREIHPGVRTATPIYDWSDGDVWKFVQDSGFDYNGAYDVMHRLGLPRSRLRIAPPTMAVASMRTLDFARRAWPKWFDQVCERLEGVRTAAMFGSRAVLPIRHRGETWQECFQRTCIEEAPRWIADRAEQIRTDCLRWHARHSSLPPPEVEPCLMCGANGGCWKSMANNAYNGDPFVQKFTGHGYHLKYVEPEFFRPGSGQWGGSPTW
jgi:predicted phosphoadenosine phosphosulfate sulfurtransferase